MDMAKHRVGMVIRGAQIPASRAEAVFKAKAMEKGWKPHRPSWPDFLVETHAGLIAVEVKANDAVSAEQKVTFSLLERCGIPVYLWRMKSGTNRRLVKWNNGAAIAKLYEGKSGSSLGMEV